MNLLRDHPRKNSGTRFRLGTAVIITLEAMAWLTSGCSRQDRDIDELVEDLRSDEVEVQRKALKDIQKYAGDTSLAIDDVIRLLSSDGLRLDATYALQSMGAGAAPAIPALISLFSSDVGFVAAAAVSETGAAAVPRLSETLRSPSTKRVQLLTLVSLAGIGSGASPTIPDVLRLIENGDEDIKIQAGVVAASVGSLKKDEIAVVEKMLDAADPAVRRAATIALGGIARHNLSGTAGLERALEDEDPLVRRQAAICLGNLGPLAKSSFHALQSKLDDVDNWPFADFRTFESRKIPVRRTFSRRKPLRWDR